MIVMRFCRRFTSLLWEIFTDCFLRFIFCFCFRFGKFLIGMMKTLFSVRLPLFSLLQRFGWIKNWRDLIEKRRNNFLVLILNFIVIYSNRFESHGFFVLENQQIHSFIIGKSKRPRNQNKTSIFFTKSNKKSLSIERLLNNI